MDSIKICEVGPRDGLQNQAKLIAVEDKIRLINSLTEAGLDYIEATSFVSSKAVPQMADADELMGSLVRSDKDALFLGLIMNQRGYERALASGAKGLGIVVVCSETLAQKNNRRTLMETFQTAKELVIQSKKDGLFTRLYLAAAWHCPYDGQTPEKTVLNLGERLLSLDIDELVFADTIGGASPKEVSSLLAKSVRAFGREKLAVHFHDTQALGMTNACMALENGVTTFDSSIGGLGGCPFAPGAAGNLATEDVVYLAERMGFQTSLDIEALWRSVGIAEEITGLKLGGRTRAYYESKKQQG